MIINVKLYENIKEMQKAIHCTEESLIINEKENKIHRICEETAHIRKKGKLI